MKSMEDTDKYKKIQISLKLLKYITTYRQIWTTYQQNTNNMTTEYQHDTNRIPIEYLQSANRVPAAAAPQPARPDFVGILLVFC